MSVSSISVENMEREYRVGLVGSVNPVRHTALYLPAPRGVTGVTFTYEDIQRIK